ncbi:MAG: glycosyltransferase family 39 protein [Anaerolineae bacterium]|nr:glycosyltransferase family 39 protein [Anaerolineae bacterium]
MPFLEIGAANSDKRVPIAMRVSGDYLMCTKSVIPVGLLRRHLAFAALLLTILPLLLIRLDTKPSAWFDEGYKMNAAYTLMRYGVYGTLTLDGFIPFDPGTSSGPVDLGLTALAFKVLGVGLVQARLISVAFGVMSAYALYRLAGYLYGHPTAVFISGIALLFPSLGDVNFILLSRQVLSESTAVGLILLGLFVWLRQFERPLWWKSIWAGALIGAGLLSKTQIAVPLVPALMVVIGFRIMFLRRNLFHEGVILAAILSVVGGWMLVGNLLTPPDIRAQNTVLLLDAIRTNILTDLFLPAPSSSALMISILMLVSIFYATRHLQRRDWLQQPVAQAEIAVGIIILFTLGWYAMWSVGWPRYSYFGLLLASMVAGSISWKFAQWVGAYLPIRPNFLMGALLAVLFVWNVLPFLSEPRPNGFNETIACVREMIPADAVIESWDWQLDAFVGDLGRIHHPPQNYLFEAIRQFSHDQTTFSLEYDLLQANPSYLIIGPFAEWTSIYADEDVKNAFVLLEKFGDYSIYGRR